MTWVLAPLVVGDLDEVMALERTLFVNDAWSRSVMRAELASEHCRYLGARVVGETALAGYAGVMSPRGSGEADIQTVAVAEPFRGRGLGRTLMVALIDEARARGALTVFLEVREDNPVARSLYVSLGFEEIGVREHYYQPDDVAAVVMRLDAMLGRRPHADEPSVPRTEGE